MKHKTKHTPGPWRSSGKTGINGNGGLRVVAIMSGIGDAQAEADARLIAAAPELLEALVEAMPVLEMTTLINAEWLAKVKATIAKATGGAE